MKRKILSFVARPIRLTHTHTHELLQAAGRIFSKSANEHKRTNRTNVKNNNSEKCTGRLKRRSLSPSLACVCACVCLCVCVLRAFCADCVCVCVCVCVGAHNVSVAPTGGKFATTSSARRVCTRKPPVCLPLAHTIFLASPTRNKCTQTLVNLLESLPSVRRSTSRLGSQPSRRTASLDVGHVSERRSGWCCRRSKMIKRRRRQLAGPIRLARNLCATLRRAEATPQPDSRV